MLRLKQQHILGEVSQGQEAEGIEFLEVGSKTVVDGVGRGRLQCFVMKETAVPCAVQRSGYLEINTRVETQNATSH